MNRRARRQRANRIKRQHVRAGSKLASRIAYQPAPRAQRAAPFPLRVPFAPLLTLAFLILTAPGAAFDQLAYAPEIPALPGSAALEAIERASPALEAAPVPATMSADLRYRRGGKLALDSKQRLCLAKAIYFEARGEPAKGQAAVAQVVLNRALTKGFPRTVCDVVYQGKHRKTGCQFSFVCDGQPDRITERKAWETAKKIADDVAHGWRRSSALTNATHYHATYVKPYWAPTMKRLARIGQHVFYHEKGRRPRRH